MHVFLALVALLLPTAAHAQTVTYILLVIDNIIDTAVGVVLSLAVLVFIWGLVQYIMKTDDPDGQKGAKSIMLYGIIGLFVAVSVWGLVAVLQNTFNLDSDTSLPAPSANKP